MSALERAAPVVASRPATPMQAVRTAARPQTHRRRQSRAALAGPMVAQNPELLERQFPITSISLLVPAPVVAARTRRVPVVPAERAVHPAVVAAAVVRA